MPTRTTQLFNNVPSTLRHYLILTTENCTVVHHEQVVGEDAIRTRILTDGELRLDPPGLVVSVEALFRG